MGRKKWLFLLWWFVHNTPFGFSQAADETRLAQEGIAEYRMGRFSKAEALLGQALDSARRRGDQDQIATISNNLGDAYLNEERFREAEQAYQQALAIFKRRPEKRVEVAATLRNLGALYSLQGWDQEALAVLKE